MQKRIQLIDRPIEETRNSFPLSPSQSGSVVEFWGVVRGEEAQKKIIYLEYEAYPEMAKHQINVILDSLEKQFPCHSVEIIHRLGKIPAGEPSLYIRIWSAHRQEGFGMLAAFCDRLKQDVPIWKKALL